MVWDRVENRASDVLGTHRRTDDLGGETDLLGHHSGHVEGHGPPRGQRPLAGRGAQIAEQLLTRSGVMIPSIRATGLWIRNVCGTPRGM